MASGPGGRWWSSAGYRLPLLSAILLVLSYPPFHFLLPPFLALVPFAVFVAESPRGRVGGYRALKGGFVLGFSSFGILLHWILLALLPSTPLALPAFLAILLVLASLVALFGWLLHTLHHAGSVALWLAVPLTWTSVEWVRGSLPVGLAFPWLGLGTSLTAFPDVVGFAELVGSSGVTFWIACVSGAAAGLVLRMRRSTTAADRRRSRSEGRRVSAARIPTGRIPTALTLPLAIALLAAPAGWGVWRASQLTLREAATVSVVQTELSPELKDDPLLAVEATLAVADEVRSAVAVSAPDLVALPETSIPVPLQGATGAAALEVLTTMAGVVDAPILVGTFGSGAEAGSRTNSAVLVDSAGPTGFRYDKNVLVPLIERGPGGLSPGRDRPIGALSNGARFGVLICYESAFPGAARVHRLGGADFLVNVTNDAWYGGGRPRLAWGLWQHRAHLVMRAIENRIGVARAANGGFSGFVDPLGRGYGVPPLFQETAATAPVYTTDVRTIYSRTGDWTGPGSAVIVLVLALVAKRRAGRVDRLNRGGGLPIFFTL